MDWYGVSTPVWMVGAHGISHTIQCRGWKCPSFHPSTHGTFFGVYDQYGCDALVCLPVLCCISLTHASIDELRVVSISIWMVGFHGISHIIQGRGWKCPSFHLSTNGISCGYCVASMDVIPLLGCLYNGRPTPHVYILMNWECCQHLFGWLELMVYQTPSKVEAKNEPVFFPPRSSILWVLCGQYECYPLPWLLIIVYQTYPCIHWWIDRAVKTCMGRLELMVHHTPSKAEDESAPVFIHLPMVHHLGVVWPVSM